MGGRLAGLECVIPVCQGRLIGPFSPDSHGVQPDSSLRGLSSQRVTKPPWVKQLISTRVQLKLVAAFYDGCTCHHGTEVMSPKCQSTSLVGGRPPLLDGKAIGKNPQSQRLLVQKRSFGLWNPKGGERVPTCWVVSDRASLFGLYQRMLV